MFWTLWTLRQLSQNGKRMQHRKMLQSRTLVNIRDGQSRRPQNTVHSVFFVLALPECNRRGIHTMSFIGRRVIKPLASEDMSQMSIARIAHNLYSVAIRIGLLTNGFRDTVVEGRPATRAIKFHLRRVQLCPTSSAVVRTTLKETVQRHVAWVGPFSSEDVILFAR